MWCNVSVALNLLCSCLARLCTTTITFKMLILANMLCDEEILLSFSFLCNWAVFGPSVPSQTRKWEFADINERTWQKHIFCSPLTPDVTQFSCILTSCSFVNLAYFSFTSKLCCSERDNSNEQRLLGSWALNKLSLPVTPVFLPPTMLTCYLHACGGVITFCCDNR